MKWKRRLIIAFELSVVLLLFQFRLPLQKLSSDRCQCQCDKGRKHFDGMADAPDSVNMNSMLSGNRCTPAPAASLFILHPGVTTYNR